MTRVLLLGATGQVGAAILQSAAPDVKITAPEKRVADFRNPATLHALVSDSRPDIVINCAAYTRVDDAETDADTAHTVNSESPYQLALASAAVGARFVHVSTDYVFDGTGAPPYGRDAEARPLNVYGESKLAGERRVLGLQSNAVVVRTAWVHSGQDANFVATAVRLFQASKVMHVVDDQISTPTRALHLANALWAAGARPQLSGLLHFTDAGVASWYDVAMCVLDTLQREGLREPKAGVLPVSTEAFPRPAVRPRVSVMDKHDSWKALGIVPQHWRVGVAASTLELTHA